jgi:penicillin-binding protein 2
LALASTPTYDPNPFVSGIGYAEYAALRDDIDHPLYNRAVRGQYPPGSTIKPFVALAGLALGEISPFDASIAAAISNCRGRAIATAAGAAAARHRRDGGGHRAVVRRLFLPTRQRSRHRRLNGFLAEFGFGARTGVDIAGELGGLLPSPAGRSGCARRSGIRARH